MDGSISWRGAVLALSFASVLGLAACGAGAPSAPPAAASALPQASLPATGPPAVPVTLSSAPPASAAPAASAALGSPLPGAAAASPAPGSARPRPSIAAAELAAFLTAQITVFNVADADVVVIVTYIDQKSGTLTPLGTYPVGTLEQLTNAVPAGRYRLDFRLPAGSASGPRCTIDIAAKDTVRFVVAAADAIAVNGPGFSPQTAADLLVSTSPLCRA